MTRYIYNGGTYTTFIDCALAVLRDDVEGFYEWLDDRYRASDIMGWISPGSTGEEIWEDLTNAYISSVLRHGKEGINLESYGVRIVGDASKSPSRKAPARKATARKTPAKRTAAKKSAAKRRTTGARR
ncbi:MAG: hypothetical protein IKP53_08260 [Candidatus Methanomethylophilaceae archaeon]|nr:hypothetical protein [Candidatus Methanomethylophilaceae archaeon]